MEAEQGPTTHHATRDSLRSIVGSVGRFLTGAREWSSPPPTVDDLLDGRGRHEREGATLPDSYLGLFQRFEKFEGTVERQYWGIHQPLGLVLTERPRNVVKRWLHRPPVMHLHRSSLRPEEPSGLHAALNEADMLAVRANWSLGDLSRHTVLHRIFDAEAFLLRMADRPGDVLSSSQLREALDHYFNQLYRIQIELNTAAVRRAQYSYTFGALAGLLLFGIAATISVPIGRAFGDHLHNRSLAFGLGCAIAGALGAAASASWKAASGDLKIDPAAGIGALPRIAMQRPGIGAIFGLAVYFALRSGFVQIGLPAKNFYFYAFFSFVAGFSERLIPGVIRRAEAQVAPKESSDPVAAPSDGADTKGSDPPPNRTSP